METTISGTLSVIPEKYARGSFHAGPTPQLVAVVPSSSLSPGSTTHSFSRAACVLSDSLFLYLAFASSSICSEFLPTKYSSIASTNGTTCFKAGIRLMISRELVARLVTPKVRRLPVSVAIFFFASCSAIRLSQSSSLPILTGFIPICSTTSLSPRSSASCRRRF